MCLVPSHFCKQQNAPNITNLAEMYEDDLPSPNLLPQEVMRWHHKFFGKDPVQCPDSCAKAIKVCDRDVFPNIHILLHIACTIPVTSCECERSASTLRRLHTYMRASMSQDRLLALAVVHIHYDMHVDTEKTVDIFANLFPR